MAEAQELVRCIGQRLAEYCGAQAIERFSHTSQENGMPVRALRQTLVEKGQQPSQGRFE